MRHYDKGLVMVVGFGVTLSHHSTAQEPVLCGCEAALAIRQCSSIHNRLL